MPLWEEYAPENYYVRYYGRVTLRETLERSLNIASVHGGQPEISDGFLAPNVPDRAPGSEAVSARRSALLETARSPGGVSTASVKGVLKRGSSKQGKARRAEVDSN